MNPALTEQGLLRSGEHFRRFGSFENALLDSGDAGLDWRDLDTFAEEVDLPSTLRFYGGL